MKYAKELVEKGKAYYCFCDKERLESLKTGRLPEKRSSFTISIVCIFPRKR